VYSPHLVDLLLTGCVVSGGAGVQAKAAAVVLQHLDPLQQQLYDLQAGTLSGDWEGALELVGRLIDALRQVG
jgi:hypothetical protein